MKSDSVVQEPTGPEEMEDWPTDRQETLYNCHHWTPKQGIRLL